MSFKTARNLGLMCLAFIIFLVSAFSYGLMHYNAQKLTTVITIEKKELDTWQYLLDLITDAKDDLYRYYTEKTDNLDLAMDRIEEVLKEVTRIRDSSHEEEEKTAADEWVKELAVFRQAVYAYSIEISEGYGGGTSAKEMENAALQAATRMIELNRETSKRIKAKISENNQSMLTAAEVSRKILGFMLAGSVLTAFLVAFFMDRALSKPITALVEGTRLVAEGDLTREIRVNSKDEIGELSRSFNTMIRDLRERKAELVRQKDYVSSIIANMAESLTVATLEGKIKTVNSATCTLLGYQEEELIGKDINILFADEEEETFLLEGNRITEATRDYQNHELNYRTKDGKTIPMLFSTSVMRDSEGAINGLICVAQDITMIKQAQHDLSTYAEKLAASNDELRHFLHIASHDLQEPLRKIKVIGDRLKDKYHEKLDAAGQDYIDRIQRSTVRMQTLINDLLTFSRVTTKARAFEPVNLSSLVQDVLDDLETRIEETGATVECEELPSVLGDSLQIRQMIQNIITNALKFRKDDRALRIRISAKMISRNGGNGGKHSFGARYCQLIFEDNGIGFDNKYADRIFGVFQRLHGKNLYEGTGIGLSICRKIAERHGGQIAAKGRPGDGARFVVTLPANPANT
ncbi:MAG: PAS domain S-box protein [Nitrospiraceae bacterium]|nr:MAG: PAS domain S-box protein [Nitrospiraceae bacterium]